MSPRNTWALYLALCLAIHAPAWADAKSWAECADIPEDAVRLRCYDSLAHTARTPPSTEVVVISPVVEPKTISVPGAQASALSKRWELEPESKQGIWSFRAHKPNYFLLGRYTDRVNRKPYDVFFTAIKDENLGLDATEAKFQLSFKLKAAEDLFGGNADLWLGYTQRNHWQVYNSNISAPFRETNYEPEVFLTFPVRHGFLGLTGRFVNLGLVHQSNGQGRLLSRSWNRAYAQFGFERGDNFSLLLKPWYRIKENYVVDDNPDITDYMGDFEMVANYRLGTHSFTALGRSNFGLDRGYMQLDWSFPVYQNLKGYIQLTTGYGESLIDYNHRQTTFGFGFMLTDWL